ncbi:nucleotidyltransferase domain-containing protein [Mesobacillus boroniphilus]|uniref:Nucleotidyltransferase domain-containing protein n=1 Tax=Mesobacillus boroniphilus TaxID=308892 RepID=A0A944CKR2_9BACI|nr:nucleotidyltransferase domain-containing protein [Mesobacillus boroniphilus]MBS8264230.1 nucleotidyltransferase domain-containing protein [Mesobacillus boroniphilus]
MEDHIITVLNQIEKEYEVKILFACDAGSRALGFAAKDSDYDIRFIYIHKQDWYLSIDQSRDVIEIPKEDTLSIFVDPKLDVVGWELTKTLRLYRKSNPSLLEWLNSKYVYSNHTGLVEKLKLLQETVISQKPYINHHLNLAKRNFIELQKKEEWKGKVYLYILRSILSAKWLQIHQQIPPVGFSELVCILENRQVESEVRELLSMKQRGEHCFTEKNKILNEFITHEIEQLGSYASLVTQKSVDHTEDLNELFRVTLKEAWK